MKREMIKLSEEDFERATNAKADTSYVGAGDPLLDLGKASSFATENNTNRRVQIIFKNTSAEDTVFVQFNKVISGVLEKCTIMQEGIVAETLKITGTPNSASILSAYLEKNPTRIHSMQFKVDDPDQLDEPIKFITISPFTANPSVEELVPASKHSQNTSNPKMVELDDCIDWMCSDKSTITYGIRPGRTVTLTIKFGASIDTAGYLTRQAMEARQTLAASLLAIKK